MAIGFAAGIDMYSARCVMLAAEPHSTCASKYMCESDPIVSEAMSDMCSVNQVLYTAMEALQVENVNTSITKRSMN